MHNNKNIKATFLLLLSALPVLVVILFIISQFIIRSAAEEALETKALTSLTINAGELKWHKPNKEIIINGHLFDVKNVVVTKPGFVKVTGLYDWQEDELYKELQNLIEDKNEEDGKKCQQFIKLITCLFDINNSNINIDPKNCIVKKGKINYTAHLSTTILNIESPPPQPLI